MRRCARWLWVALAAGAALAGCGTSTTVGITLTPVEVSLLTNGSVQFTAGVSGSTASPAWSVNDIVGGNTTVGTITTAGVYTAPATVPLNSDDTPEKITISATIGSAIGIATVSIDSGVRVSVAPSAFTIGTGEQFTFRSFVSGVTDTTTGPNCGPGQAVSCAAVTWSLTPTGDLTIGTINSTTGAYTAPPAVPTSTVNVVATSVLDASETATGTITIVTASDPLPALLSPTTGAIGAPFEDVTLTGTGFISTTNVFIDHLQVPSQDILSETNGTALRVRVPDSFLALLPQPPSLTTTVIFTAARQGGQEQNCATPCELILSPVRPAVVGTTPDSILLGSVGALSFNVDGGFFGTASSPVVTATFAGKAKSVQIGNDDRQLSVIINGSDVNAPGLYPVGIFNDVFGQGAGAPRAVANLAVQPNFISQNLSVSATLNVGKTPGSVAIDSGTGLAVVSNEGSGDVTLIDLTPATPTVVGYICTGTVGAVLNVAETACPTASGPTSVAVDNLRHIALVANSTTNNAAVIDLQARQVTSLISSLLNGAVAPAVPFTPAAVGINPASGRALLVYGTTNNASIIDLTLSPPAIIGTVNIGTGSNPRVSVSPRLNWAVVSPGGQGTLAIVDLGQQNINAIVSASRTGGITTINTLTTHTLQANDSVLIQGMSDPSFNGVFTVSTVLSSTAFTYVQPTSVPNAPASGGAVTGGTASYSTPVATVGVSSTVTGVGVNDETHQVILADPIHSPQTFIFNALDQSVNPVLLPPAAPTVGYIGAAFDPLANIGVVTNQLTNQAFVIDPETLSVPAAISVGTKPVDAAIDPGTDIALIVNQGSGAGNGTVSVVHLGDLRTPQIFQTSLPLSGPSFFSGQAVLVGTNLSSLTPPSPSPLPLTIVGKGLGNAVARLDGAPLATVSQTDRVLVATVPASMQLVPRRFALDVMDQGTGAVSNAMSLAVIFSVDLTSNACPTPSPEGVAIDPDHNVAAVTEPGCTPGNVALISLPGGPNPLGTGPTVAVGTNPRGVAIFAQTGAAVVANQGSNTADVIDVIGGSVTGTVITDSDPSGVAIDQNSGTALVTALSANLLDAFSVQSASAVAGSIGVQQGPIAVGVDPTDDLAAVANGTSNDVTLVSVSGGGAVATISNIEFPTAVAFDPILGDFLIASSLQNSVQILNPSLQATTSLRVGINPVSIGYNPATVTLVTGNAASHTMTVVDFLSQTVRDVFPMAQVSLYGVDIHPLTNLAIVADPANNRALLVPLPR